jgi:hypothetical protein
VVELEKHQKYKLDLMGVQEVRWEGKGHQIADNHTFLHQKGNIKSPLRDKIFHT